MHLVPGWRSKRHPHCYQDEVEGVGQEDDSFPLQSQGLPTFDSVDSPHWTHWAGLFGQL